jgi:hypothetical protein
MTLALGRSVTGLGKNRSPLPRVPGAEARKAYWTTKELGSERWPGTHDVHKWQVGDTVSSLNRLGNVPAEKAYLRPVQPGSGAGCQQLRKFSIVFLENPSVDWQCGHLLI